MAQYPFRILLETVEGRKSSYMSSSFVDTSVDLVLSASQVYNRITGSLSCSYQNTLEFSGSFPGSNFHHSKTFKDSLILSSSLTGSLVTGSIEFHATDTEYDGLLRYKFFGEKVCNTLGLPHNQWVYVDQVRFPADEESNIFQGNIVAKNIYLSDNFTIANNANFNSDVPFLIDTGSDRHIKFIDQRSSGSLGLFIGYDKDEDVYEMGGSDARKLHINDVDRLRVDQISGSSGAHNLLIPRFVDVGSADGSSIITLHGGTDGVAETELMNNTGKFSISNTYNHAFGDIELRTYSFDNAILIDNSNQGVAIGGTTSGGTSKLKVFGNIESTTDITASGNIYAKGDIIAQRYVVSSSVTNVTTLAQSGSTIFGDTPADDTHQFTGSVFITGSEMVLQSIDPRIRLKAIGANHPGLEYYEDGTRKWILYNDPDNSDNFTIKNNTTDFFTISQTGVLTTPLTSSANISSSGVGFFENVAISEPVPTNTALLHVGSIHRVNNNKNVVLIEGSGSAGTGMQISQMDTVSTNTFWYAQSNKVYFGCTDNESLNFQTDNITRVQITKAGSASFGTTVQSGKQVTVEGDISASGTYFGKQYHYTHHNFAGVVNRMFLPFNSTADDDSVPSHTAGYQRRMIVPYDGELKKLLIRAENAPGNTSGSMWKAGAASDMSQASTSDTVNMSAANTTYTLTFSSGNTFSAGEVISIAIDPTNDVDDAQATAVWLYTVSG